ncbi:MAG: hypothetical protein DCO81_07900 [Candidatus Aquiluna sp. XM-24bin5]|nr:MAG: hypothetical protein DCO81_07900 [Candidatus Aquiluna sp. XM-24bin5]
MVERLLTPPLETLRPHFDLSKTRFEALAVLLFGLANCRTVNLLRLASQFPGEAKHGPNYQRLQRFFQHLLERLLCITVVPVRLRMMLL